MASSASRACPTERRPLKVKDAARKARRIWDDELIREGLSEPPSSTRLSVAIRVRGATGLGQDRSGVFELERGHVLVVAEGAGGTSGGAQAADFVVDAIGGLDTNDVSWVDFLRVLDGRLSTGTRAGETTTAVIASIRDGYVLGASVGDSGAWLLHEGKLIDLTESQFRKPLLGSGT